MRITIRLIIALALAAGVVAAGATFAQVTSERRRLLDDLERRASILAESVDVSIDPAEYAAQPRPIDKLVSELGRDERLRGVGVFDAGGAMLAGSPSLAGEPVALSDIAKRASREDKASGGLAAIAGRESHVFAIPLHSNSDSREVTGSLVVLQDTAQLHARLADIWRHNFLRLLLQVFLLSLVALYIVRWNIMAPIDQIADWMRTLRSGQQASLRAPPEDMFAPLAKEAATLAHDVLLARRAVEEQARLSEGETFWTAQRLKEHVRGRLGGKSLLVVSNREPYMHVQSGKRIETIVPAAGLVTALDPVLRACGGTWIAHGSGDADWRRVDDNDRLRVPEHDPRYVLRRVALTKEEEDGYYYGFSNQGLWPLCLRTHQRPVFRESDWKQYQAVNRKFAEVALRELEGMDEPCVLIQDYQFALLPRLLKRERPDARIALFWHIPWPSAEAFSICPWQRELLYGLLGADLLGFHTQQFCNNFFETVDAALESRIRWESFSVEKEGHRTVVKPFPVSVGFPQVFSDVPLSHGRQTSKAELLKELGVKAARLGLGVERMDYTKGLLERFAALERFFAKHPEYLGEFTFVELGAPSRTHIKAYHDFMAQVEAEVDRINRRFMRKEWRPIVLLQRHHSHAEILPYYEAADVCMVTSLHDGMNLVAKEFVAARNEEDGVLILSRFAGASSELRDALSVNPYDVERMADALHAALDMPKNEQALRMRRMRQALREYNIYRWGGSLVGELARVRLEVKPAERAS